MTPSVYYNEIDPFAAAWLRELIHQGHLPDGTVDTRPIQEVQPDDLLGFTQCHFFAGIGGWAHALRLAGWPDDRPVWTGSCPCQPFSNAGRQAGTKDARHLWPAWFRLITECHPAVVFGEQVESAIRHGWWDLVQRDLEGEDYACGMAVLGAHSVGAPHQRQRCWFVAESQGEQYHGSGDQGHGWGQPAGSRRMAVPQRDRRPRPGVHLLERGPRQAVPLLAGTGAAGLVGDPDQAGPQGRHLGWDGAREQPAGTASLDGLMALSDGRLSSDYDLQRSGRYLQRETNETSSFWSPCDWLPCRDHVARPVEPGTFPLAHGVPVRVGRLRGYGNAIVPQVAHVFIETYLEDLRGDRV